ncbi:MAG TPA: hypothetical protein VII13_00745 [Vicinamibacteria bacterium]|jgi:hypothetical protein
MTLRTTAALALALTGAATAAAQALVPGERVRVDAPGVGEGVLVGTLRAARPDGLRVQMEGRDWAMEVPLPAVRGLWVSRGTRSKAALGAVLGAAAGAAAGYFLFDEDEQVDGQGDGRGLAMVFGGAAGAAAGGLLGTAFKSEKWEPVSLASMRPRADLLPTPFRVRLRF